MGRGKWGMEEGKKKVEAMARTEGLSKEGLGKGGRKEETVVAPFRCWDAAHGGWRGASLLDLSSP